MIWYDKKEFEKISDVISYLWADLNNDFLNHVLRENYLILEKSLALLNFKFIQTIFNLIKRSFRQNFIYDLIDILNQHRYIYEIVGDVSDFSFLFERYFYKNAKSEKEKLGITQLWWWRFWWWYLVFTVEGLSSDTIVYTLKSIKTYYPNANIVWDNRSVKQFYYPMIIEQYLDEDILWEGFNKKIYILEDISTWIRKIITDLEEVKNNFDVLIDINRWKILIWWKKVTSNEIHSQRKLVEVLLLCLYNQKRRISNKEFYKSSYTENFSDFSWKIVYPFKKLINERLNKDITFEVRKDFTWFKVFLDVEDLKVWIIEKR